MRYWIIILVIFLVIAGIIFAEKTGMFIAAKAVFEQPFKCEPNFVYLTLAADEDQCEGICYHQYRITSFELREGFRCYCDVNNCNPR